MKSFEDIGIYGFNRIKEDAVLTSLFTGDPLILIGQQGTAKTALIEAIGGAFRERSKRMANKALVPGDEKLFDFNVYDCSKINFEDLVGFPSPAAMNDDRMDFIKSPLTAWDKDVIGLDEFSRQEPARQNNLFELVRSRKLMGRPTGTKWIFAAMNPYGMAGTEALDEALVDRFQFFIHVLTFKELKDKDQESVVRHIGGSDGPAMKMWSNARGKFDTIETVEADGKWLVNDRLADAGQEIHELMVRTVVHFNDIMETVGETYAVFIARYWKNLSAVMDGKDWKVELTGRRAGMVWRALMAFRAIDLARCDMDPTRTAYDLKEMFKEVLKISIPVGIATSVSDGINGMAANSIAAGVDLFGDFFTKTTSVSARRSVDAVYELMTTRDVGRKIELLIGSEADEIAKSQVWANIMRDAQSSKVTNENIRSLVTIGIVSHLMTIKPNIVPKTMQALIAKESAKVLKLEDVCNGITIKGQLAFYAKQIETFVNGFTNPFIKIQAKYSLEGKSEEYKNSDVSLDELQKILDEVKASCSNLERVLARFQLLDEDSNIKQTVVAAVPMIV